MRFKRLLALLLAAALALGLLAGCGGGESVASALLKLLDGRYPNISIEIDPELEADLRQAIRKAEAKNAGDDDAVIRAALETALGSTITFRYLGDGQKGDTTFDLVFYAGSDPDKAAQAAYSQWNATFSNVPADGKYDTSLAMVETNSGVWMLVKATVEKAGTVDKPDSEPEPEKVPYTDNGDNSYTVSTKDGLQKLFADNPNSDFVGKTITLDAGTEYTVDTTNGPLAETFKGELQGNGATVTITGRTQGLFNSIGDVDKKNGTVKDLTIQVDSTITGPDNSHFGAVAMANYGTIQNCDVKGGTIKGSGSTGGIVGSNRGTIEDCSVEVKVEGSGHYTGGIAGSNKGTITACRSTGTVTSDNSNSSNSSTGGVVGWNDGGTVTACYSTGDVTGKNSGGVVGLNKGSVTACYHANGTVSGNNYIGGVVGRNPNGTVTACYWSGMVKDEDGKETNAGIGSGSGDATQVTGNVTWQTAYEAMDDAARGYYSAPEGNNPPKLIWEKPVGHSQILCKVQ